MDNDPRSRIQQIRDVQALKAYLAFANPILEVVEDDPYMLREYPLDRLMDEIARDRRAVFVLYGDDGEIIGGAMTKFMDASNKRTRRFHSDAPMVFWEYEAIAPAERGKGLIRVFNDVRLAWTREHGAHEIVGEIVTDNFRQLRVYFAAGFVATHLLPPMLGIPVAFFILRRPVEYVAEDSAAPNHLVVARDLPGLRKRFALGESIVGINRLGDRTSSSPFDWQFIMRRV